MAKVSQISVISATEIKQMEKGDEMQIGEEEDNKNGQIELVDLRNRLCRFHLIGPKSIEFLRKMIRVVDEGEMGKVGEDISAQFREIHQWWINLSSGVLPGNFRNGQIVSLLVEDPRLFRAVPIPQKQQQQSAAPGGHHCVLRPILYRPPSALFADWQFFHQNLLPKRLSHSEFESLCADKLARPKRTEFKVPILLVFRRLNTPSSSVKNVALHCVDLLCPSGVGYDFWLALQFAGFRPIGLHDKRALDFEAGIGTFPDDFADCAAGRVAAQTETKHLMMKYERKPHNRRVPFGEKGLNVAHPFTFEWGKLLSEWDTNGAEERKKNANIENKLPFFVLRDRQALKRLDLWFTRRLNANKKGHNNGTAVPPPILEEHFGGTFSVAAPSAVLVPVFVRMMRRGVPKRLSFITLPTDQDMQMLRSGATMVNNRRRIVIKEEQQQQQEKFANTNILSSSFGTECNGKGQQMTKCPSSPSSAVRHIPEFISLHDQQQQQQPIAHFLPTNETFDEQLLSLDAMFPDVANDKERRRKAKNASKRAKKRAKIVDRKKETETEGEKGQPMETEILEEEEKGRTTRNTRTLIGRVVRGDYAFGNAQGMAFGFIPLNALAAVARTNGIVLVRNTTSKYYHPAKMHIHLVEQNNI